MIKNIKEGPE